jgi:hypothetical protein
MSAGWKTKRSPTDLSEEKKLVRPFIVVVVVVVVIIIIKSLDSSVI